MGFFGNWELWPKKFQMSTLLLGNLSCLLQSMFCIVLLQFKISPAQQLVHLAKLLVINLVRHSHVLSLDSCPGPECVPALPACCKLSQNCTLPARTFSPIFFPRPMS